MALTIGRPLGSYQILAKLGEGGMGEVYRARDTRLNRDVAIKVLPDRLTGDTERAARFEREAQALAALNHPNIAQIYGVEHVTSAGAGPGAVSDRRTALVMELVEGPTLDDLIRRKCEVSEVISIAKQVASALEDAHARNIIHRDLKPANVKVKEDGTVKVLDFGLARIATSDPTSGAEATMTSPAMTSAGVILGTASYMSPEQARGRAVDKRADIWAFGCVLYEMLTGNTAFGGETVTDVLAAVVTRDPDWTALSPQTPSGLASLVRRCLRKDPKNRLHDIADARIELEAIAESRVEPRAELPVRSRSRLLMFAAAIGTLLVGGAAGAAWGLAQRPVATEWAPSRLGGPAIAFRPRLSPDGHLLAFIAKAGTLSQVAVMKPGTGSWSVLTHDRTRGLVDDISWAADSGLIYYDRFIDAPNGIYSVPNLGGEERLVVENASSPFTLSDGSLLFGRVNEQRQWQLHRFWPGTGKTEALPFGRSSLVTNRGLLAAIDATHIAIAGRPMADKAVGDALYVFDLESHEARRFGPDLDLTNTASLVVDPTDRSVLVAQRDANASRILRLRPGTERVETVMTQLANINLDVVRDGSLYVSLDTRPSVIVRFSQSGDMVEAYPMGPSRYAVPLADGRTMHSSRIGGRTRVVVIAPGKEPVNVIPTDEDTQSPMTPVGADRVAIMIGAAPKLDIAVVSLATGRLVKRLEAPPNITSLGASPDDTTLYVSAGGVVSAIPAAGGPARAIGAGDSLVVDPDKGDLIVKLDEVGGFRLARLPAAGGPPRPVAIQSTDLRMIPEPLTPGSIRRGRLVLPVGTVDSWDWFVAVLDLASGQITRVPLKYETDFHYAAWLPDGRIVGAGSGMDAALWKFEKREMR